MPLYIYKCAEQHEHESFHHMDSYPVWESCECGGLAKLIIRPASLHISIDKTSEREYAQATGQNFSSRRELNSWMRENETHEVCPEEAASGKQFLKDYREAKKDGVELRTPINPVPKYEMPASLDAVWDSKFKLD